MRTFKDWISDYDLGLVILIHVSPSITTIVRILPVGHLKDHTGVKQ